MFPGVVHNFQEFFEDGDTSIRVPSDDCTMTPEQKLARKLTDELSGDQNSDSDDSKSFGSDSNLESTHTPLTREEKFSQWLDDNGEQCHPAFVRDGLVKKLRVFGVHQFSAYSRQRITRYACGLLPLFDYGSYLKVMYVFVEYMSCAGTSLTVRKLHNDCMYKS